MNNITKEKSYKIFIWITLTLFFILQYTLRVLPNQFTLFFIENFKVSSTKLGQIFGAYYIGYAIFHVIFGFLADRGHLKNIVIFSLLGILLSLAMSIYFYDNWFIVLVARLILGACSASAITVVIKTSVIYFKNFSFVISLTAFLGIISSGYLSKFLFYYYEINNWNDMNAIIMYVVGSLLLISFIVLPSNKLSNSQSNIIKKSIFATLLCLFKNKKFVILCIMGALMAGTIEGFADAWSNSFFATVYGSILTSKEISNLTPIILLSYAIGTLLMSMISDLTRKYYLILIVATLIMIISFLIILSGTLTSNIQLTITCIILGAFSGYQVTIMALGIKKSDPEIAVFAGSILNTIIMLGGYLFHSMIGFIFASNNTILSFQHSLIIIPIGLIIAIVLGMYLYISDKELIE